MMAFSDINVLPEAERVKRGDGAAGDGVDNDEGEEVDEGVPEVEDIGIVVLSMSLGLC